MTESEVLIERRPDHVAVLTLNRPDRLNALSSSASGALKDAIAEVESDDSVRVVVVAGAGRAFCAGADITELDSLEGSYGFSSFVTGLTTTLRELSRSAKPSVAAIHGLALGGGFELALSCDLRVADETAKLGVPEVKLGLLPGATGTARLTRVLPNGLAKQLLFTGESLTAADAARLGLVNEVVDAGDALGRALALAGRLAELPPLALATAKRLVDEGSQMAFDAAVSYERDAVSMLFGTQDRVEGVRAFLEKRPARFEGR